MKKILLVGDSISLHYGNHLRDYLKDVFEMKYKPGREVALERIDEAIGGNGGDSSKVLKYIDELNSSKELDFNVFIFNCGLHDIKRAVPEENYQVDIETYKKNIDKIYSIMKSRGIECIFITTTPVLERAHNVDIIPAGIKRYNKDVKAYNEAALSVVNKYGGKIIDLYSLTSNLTGEVYLDYAHFNYEVRKVQAAFIAGNIMSLCK